MTMLGPTGRRWATRVALAGTSAAIGLVATGAVFSPASADAPVKTGWWNFASGGGQAAPGPDVNAGGLRVAVASQQDVSFGAVEYSLPRDASGTLTLSITQMTGNAAAMQNTIVACPTATADWPSGDDQDWSKKPDFSCDSHQFVGQLSSDGKTLLFNVDGGADVTDGTLSLAIVPLHTVQLPAVGTDPGTGTDVTPPFAIDFDKPSASSLTSDAGSSSSDSAPPPPPPVPTTGDSTGSVSAAPPVTGADVTVPPATTDAGGQSPVVAGQPTTTGPGATVPAAAIAPTKTDDNKRNLLLVLLVLLLFAILYTQNATPRVPRPIGPRGRTGDADAAAAVAAVPYPAGFGAPRGLGRFAKQRSEAARPLI
jgi:hypothetical protein